MPELPEVQTIVDDLGEKVVGKTITDVWSDYKKAVRPSFAVFKKGVLNRRVIDTERRGKHLVLNLNSGYSIVIHLKMIGHLLFKKKGEKNKRFEEKINQYIHHIIYFKGGDGLAMSDMRKFAWMRFVKTDKVEKMKEISQLGIDALSDRLSLKKFEELLGKKKNSKIGVVILDQKWIAGVGNIYRSEILFEAGIAPERLVKDLKGEERKKLYQAMRKVLRKSVKMRGTSTVDYRDTSGEKGGFQNFLKVYGREGEKCLKCKGRVERLKLSQRSVFWCRKCQR
ncbi:MAG: DNA-formamidopyrimidine glycosylase [Patescibacteria group bacterium]|nr:DNA-formamidopyrimidine glycosylase [Patescibacteria group bacterium]